MFNMSRKRTVLYMVAAVVLAVTIAALSAGYVGLKVGPIYDKNKECCRLKRLPNLFLSLKEFAGFVEFHSQMDQDRWIVHSVFPGVTNGYFVDVGAGDGVKDSNTKVLEDLGWSGVCIDPFPTNMNNRTCAIFKEVVDSATGRKVRFRAAGIFGGIENYLGLFKDYEFIKRSELREFTTTTLEEILARAKAPNFIHYISLDIEGGELEALKAFPFAKYNVGAFTIEHNFEEPKRSQIKALLASKGYRLVRSVIQDDYYILDQK
jgi:hypothetical protein